ncbi:hypothetical protein F66182_9078 [Fusarium sp. NRRL 66182]|nr:hypothetical protein F66182_9078 [Fusarium sp. NRRL 66182]
MDDTVEATYNIRWGSISSSNQDVAMDADMDTANEAPPMVSLMSNFRSRPSRGTRQHRCSICPQTFARNEHLIRHERSRKPLQRRVSLLVTSLVGSNNTDRGEKPFRCSICHTQFTRKDLIKRHIRRQHPGQAPGNESEAILQSEQPQEAPSQLNPSTSSAIPFMNGHDPLIAWKPPTPDSTGGGPRSELFGTVTDTFDFDAVFWGVDCGDGSGGASSTRPQIDAASINAFLEFQENSPLLGAEFNTVPALPLSNKTAEQAPAAPESPMLGAFEISESKRDSMASMISTIQPHNNLQLPSCLQLERFITACFDSFFNLLPCVHLPTWRAEDAEPCLLLALTSFGAKYSKRHDVALVLHRLARAATLHQVSVVEVGADGYPTWLMQALFFVACFGTWSGQLKLSQEALASQTLLADMFRSGQVRKHFEERGHLSFDWAEWVAMETAIRTRWVIYQYFSLMTRTFHQPPSVYNAEIDLPMPCVDSEWTAPTSQEWLACHAHSPKRPLFLTTLDSLLGLSTDVVPFISPFGAHITLHALMQQLWYMRQDRWSPCSSTHTTHLRQALDKWEAMAQLEHESSISPCKPKAMLSYNSHSLLRLARVALHGDLGNVHVTYSSHSIESISKAMMTGLSVGRLEPDTKAALLAAQSLRVPLKVGVALNTGCGTLQYQLFTLDSGLYLSRWLHNLLTKPEMSWSQEEKEVVVLATSTIREVELPPEKKQKPLSSQIAYACCEILSDINTWGVSAMLLAALEKYADHLT